MTDVQNDTAHSTISPQHTTSFEQLRQIVTAISPNSKPRRRRGEHSVQPHSQANLQAQQNGQEDKENRGDTNQSSETVSSLDQFSTRLLIYDIVFSDGNRSIVADKLCQRRPLATQQSYAPVLRGDASRTTPDEKSGDFW